MYSNHVRCRQELLQAQVDEADRSCGFIILSLVVGDHLHAEAAANLRGPAADPPSAKDAQAYSLEFNPTQLLPVEIEPLHSCQAFRNFSGYA